MAVIRELDTNRYEPVQLMDTLSQVIVEKRMWYTALDIKSDLINISGIAMTTRPWPISCSAWKAADGFLR